MNHRPLRAIALTCVALALAGCVGQPPVTPTTSAPSVTPSASATPDIDTWNVELSVDAFEASGSAVITYADKATKAVEFSGPETRLNEAADVPLGGTVSVKVKIETPPADGDPVICMIAGNNELAGGEIVILTSEGGLTEGTFTFTWTNKLGAEGAR